MKHRPNEPPLLEPLAYFLTWNTYGTWLPGDERGWDLHAVNCRTNHLHVVVTALIAPKRVRMQLKAWCTRRLKDLESQRCCIKQAEPVVREQWWAERGSQRWIDDEDSLEAVILYVRDGQD